MTRRILAFGDDYGLPLLLRHLPADRLVGIVAASIRPHQHAALRELAAGAGVPFHLQPRRDEANYVRFLSTVRALAPDFFIVSSYSMRLWPDLLGIVDGRGINIHGALLPQYRGANPVQWALINDEQETGVTLHCLSDGIDEGDLISQRRVEIGFEDTWRDIQARIAEATDRLLAEDLAGVLANRHARQPQDGARAGYYRRRRPEDGRIDWGHTTRQIYNLIRALVRPHPGAFYESAAGKVTIDEYLTIAEVFALKHHVAGFDELEADGVRLLPLARDNADQLLRVCDTGIAENLSAILGRPLAELRRTQAQLAYASNAAIVVLASAAATAQVFGLVALRGIDWTTGSARLESRFNEKGASIPGVWSIGPRVAELYRRELRLSRIAT